MEENAKKKGRGDRCSWAEEEGGNRLSPQRLKSFKKKRKSPIKTLTRSEGGEAMPIIDRKGVSRGPFHGVRKGKKGERLSPVLGRGDYLIS